MKQLNVGDVIYQIYRGKPYRSMKITRVTPKRAYSGTEEFEREYENSISKRGVDEYGMYEYKIETPELKYERETLNIAEYLKAINFHSISPDKLRELKAIIERP